MKGDVLKKLAEMGNVWFDIAMVEGVGGTANLLKQIPASQVVFGSHAPFFYLESSQLKLKESALGRDQALAIGTGNASRVLRRR